MPNMNTHSLRIKKIIANVKNFQKQVKGHGEGHMFKIYDTVGGSCHKEHTCQI